MNKIVAQLIGETVADLPPEAGVPAEAAPAAVGQPASASPTVEQLLQTWKSGGHEAVALRVLDALDSYKDFLDLASRIGHAGALELGQIMDAYTSDEHSPHKYDEVPDTHLPKSGARPGPGEAAGAVGEME